MTAAEIGDWTRAARLLTVAARARPRDIVVVRTLAEVFESQGRFRAAIQAYERALALRPGDPVGARDLAAARLRWALERRRRGERRGALDELLRAARIDPFVPDLLRTAAPVAVETGGDGIDAFARALHDLPPEATALGMRALAREAGAEALEAIRSRLHRLKNLLTAAGEALPSETIRSEVSRLLDASADLDRPGPPLEASRAILAGLVEADAARPAGARLERKIDLPSDPLVPSDLSEVVANLVRNAFEAAGEDGAVRLEARIDGAPDVAELRITVEDDGPGVRPEDRERIFLPGFTSKPNGSGWGLFAARRAVEAAGGHLYLSGLGGSTFVVSLPVRAASVER